MPPIYPKPAWGLVVADPTETFHRTLVEHDVSFTALLQAIIDGVLTGGVYALMAAGLTLIFGVMDIINIAQGVMVILGAYLSYVLSVHLGIGLLPGLLITVPAMFLLGVAIEFCFMRRLRDQDRTQMSILVTYAVAIVIEGVLTAIFGVDYRQLSGPLRQQLGARARLLPAVHLPDRFRPGGRAAGRPSTTCCTGPSSAGRSAPRCRTAPPPT